MNSMEVRSFARMVEDVLSTRGLPVEISELANQGASIQLRLELTRPREDGRHIAEIRSSYSSTEATLDRTYSAGLLNHDESFDGMVEMCIPVLQSCLDYLDGEGVERRRGLFGLRTVLDLPTHDASADIRFTKK